VLSCLLVLAACPAFADHRLTAVAAEEGDWLFQPVFDSTTGRVTDVIALLLPEKAVGANLVGVWYTRGATDTSPWTAQTWTTTSIDEVIHSVKINLAIPDADDHLWNLGDLPAANALGSTASPVGYSDGLLSSDPLVIVLAGDPNRYTTIQGLTATGYASATTPIEAPSTGSTCGPVTRLTALAKGGEAWVTDGDGMAAEEVAYDYRRTRCAATCFPLTWTSAGPTVWTPATPPPTLTWKPDGSTYIPDSSIILCWYKQEFWQSQTRTRTHRYTSCATATCLQKRVRKMRARDYCILAGESCPQTPACSLTATFSVVPGSLTGWTPSCQW
jgi:hypothetical protein